MTASTALNAEYAAGDVLRSSWGYEQTNVNFYEVVALIGKSSLAIRPIAGERTYSSDMAGTVVPVAGDFIGAVRKVRCNRFGGVKISDYSRAYKHDGRPSHFSTYA